MKNMGEFQNLAMRHRWHISLFLLLGGILACREPLMISAWNNAGSDAVEMGNYSSYEMEDGTAVIGIQNDSDNLYIILKAKNAATGEKIKRSGLTLWLNGKGKKEKTFGIQYPLGMQAMMQKNGPGRGEPPKEMKKWTEGPGGFPPQISGTLDSFVIIGPGKNEKCMMPKDNDAGIRVSLSDKSGPLIYEIAVPLRTSGKTPFAIAPKSEYILLGLETGSSKIKGRKPQDGERPDRGGGAHPGRPGGGAGGFGDGGDWGGDGDWGESGSGGGGMGGPPGGGPGRGKRPGGMKDENGDSALKFWAKVKLANVQN